ncbi:MAG: DUF87 domain-containing protein [Armatimonadetes bacterium]|nr:DUF87 domain-containing protein [Armatimonadota bacterium]
MSERHTLKFDKKRAAGTVGVDLEKLVSTRCLVQANSGGGKSYMLRYMLEQTHGRVQQIVLDPEGEFASLRERFDYVLVGAEGDVPTSVKTAKLLCRKLVELGASAVIDLYDLSLDDRKKFVRLFLEELMHLPRTLWRPLLVVIDEAHNYCPERGYGESESLHAVIDLCTKGRKRGFSAVLATQRIAKLHKDTAAELLNKFIGRTNLDIDVKRAGDELGFDKEGRMSLKKLQPGDFYAVGPALDCDEVIAVRPGSIQTTHPEPGKVAPPAPPAPKAVKAMLAQFQGLEAQSEEQAQNLEEALSRIEVLERQLRAKQGAPVVDQKAVQSAYEKGKAEGAEPVAALKAALTKARKQLGVIRAALDADAEEEPMDDASKKQSAPRKRKLRVAESPMPIQVPDTGDYLRAGERRILATLGRYHPMKLTRPQLGTLSRFAHKGGTFMAYMGNLKRQGLVSETSGEMSLTPEGCSHVGVSKQQPQTKQEVLDMWRSALRAGERKMLDAVLAAHPSGLSRTELGAQAGFTVSGGTFGAYLGNLRRNALVEVKDDQVFLGPALSDNKLVRA